MRGYRANQNLVIDLRDGLKDESAQRSAIPLYNVDETPQVTEEHSMVAYICLGNSIIF